MKKEPGMAYDTKKLNKVFAVLAVLLLFAVLWMFVDDYLRPWKAVQLKAIDIKQQHLNDQIAATSKDIDQVALKNFETSLKQAEQELESKATDISRIEREIGEVEKKIYAQNMTNGVWGSKSGEYQFNYEHYNVAKETQKAEIYYKKMKEAQANFDLGRDKLKAFQSEENSLNKKLLEIKNSQMEIDKKIKEIIGARDRLTVAANLNSKSFVWLLRNLPFLDYLDPTVKIKQVVLKRLTDDRYFQQTTKVDRCTTCHVFIDQKGFENQENPYKTHPHVDTLAAGPDSKHPLKEFGCTSCHGGEGHRVNDFNSAAHVPQNEKQKQDWIKKYQWHEPHKVPQPMLPLQYAEGMCIKCHQGVEYLPMAHKLNKGKRLIENYGCYGCHKIEGWADKVKPGPSLLKIAGKITPEFTKNWIWSPHSFNHKSRMPAFFNQANNSNPEFMALNVAEVNSMVEYLYKNSESYTPFAKYTSGDAENGKHLIQTIGCIGCHQVEGIDEPYSKTANMSGPYLTGIGSKVSGDWLKSWILKPAHYQENTIMPKFRLTEKEANDLTAYMLSLKNKTFESLKFEILNPKMRDQLLIEDFSTFETEAAAKLKLSALSEEERTLALGKKSISKYGCYSCHQIAGFDESMPPIGPELSAVGSKPVEQFGFGQQKQVPHTRHDWITNHLEQPSRWDLGVPKKFKDLTKMPNFYLNPEEITSITGFLLGLVNDYVPASGKKILNAREAIAEEGKKVATKYNCYGCHNIEGHIAGVNEVYKDDQNAGPPWLMKEGLRVHSEWLYHFLRNVHPIRTYLTIRMPSFNFSDDEVNKLVAYFAAESDQTMFADLSGKVNWEPGEREAAIKIFNELACTSCHSTGFTNDTAQGPDLHQVKMRLREAWIKKWLNNPQAILPYTPMPNFWDDGKTSAVPGVLDDNPEKQINALVKYLLEMSQNDYPKGTKYKDL
ncbi:MAG: c-type cytochrome [Bacteriovoracaceae bacterium]|nr:c-type cytochrome [Bacteriovoracaceae bacterium]